MTGDLASVPLARRVEKAFASLAKAARARRLYHANNAILIRANEELLETFEELLRDTEQISVKVRPDAFVFEGERVYEEDRSEESIPFIFYREGIRRLDFLRGLEPKEVNTLVDATLNGMSFSGLGDDLVSYLWRHELEHLRYLAVDTALADSVEEGEQGFDVEGRINDLLRLIYGSGSDDVGPRAMHVDLADLSAKSVAEGLTAIDEMAPGFHPARGLFHPPRYATELAEEAKAEDDDRLVARVLYCSIEALAQGEIDDADAESLSSGLLRMYDQALIFGRLRQATKILGGFRAVSNFERAAPLAEKWLAAALDESRLRPAITTHASTPSPEAFDQLTELIRAGGTPAVSTLLAALPSIQDPQRRRAISDLALQIGILDPAQVRSLLATPLAYVQQEALHLLGAMAPAQQLELAMSCLEDADPKVAALGGRVLGHLATAEAEEILGRILNGPDVERRPPAVLRALLDSHALITQSRGVGLLVRKLARADAAFVTDQIEAVAVAATDALRLVPTQGSFAALRKASDSLNPRVREASRRAMLLLKKGRVEAPPLVLESERLDSAAAPGGRGGGGADPSWRGKYAADTGPTAKARPSSALATEGAGSQKSGLSVKTIELGRAFLSSLFMGIRTAQFHDAQNRAFETALNMIREAADALFAATGGFSLQFIEETAFLNGTRLPFEGRSYETMQTLKNILEAQGLGGINLRSPPTYDAIKKLVLLFAPHHGSAISPEHTKMELAAESVELLGVKRFNEEGTEEVTVDRRVFAVQSYAKLILSWREQRLRVLRDLEGPKDGPPLPPPQVRAVRVIQNLVELCGDRMDLLLRLASNHEGAEPEELHAANTCVMSLALAHALGCSRQDLVDIGIASLFATLPPEKSGAKPHARANAASARMLAAGGVPRSAHLRAVIAGEAAVVPGEPSAWGRTRPARHVYARLLTVTQAFDGLTGGLGTPDGRRRHALDALAELTQDGSGRMDPRIVDLLMNLLRAFPKGVRVSLETGETAVVRTQLGSSRWDRPVVQVDGSHARSLDLMARSGERFPNRIVETVFEEGAAVKAQVEALRAPLPRLSTGEFFMAPARATEEAAPPTVLTIEPPAEAGPDIDIDAAIDVDGEPVPEALPLDALQIITDDIPKEPALDAYPTLQDMPRFWLGTRLAELEQERGVRATDEEGAVQAYKLYRGVGPQKQPVAIKALDRLALDDPRLLPAQWVMLFMREGQLAFSLDHPAVPRLLAATTIGEASYLVYEWPDALPFPRAVAAGPIDPERFSRDLLQGVAHVHAKDTLVGGFSLQHLHVRASGAPYYGDLSWAAPAAGPLHPLMATNTSSLCPELMRGGGYDRRSEQFVLGALLYHALTGLAPFGDPAAPDYGSRLVTHPLRSPLQVRPDFPTRLAAVLLRMLEKEPARRFASMDDAARALG